MPHIQHNLQCFKEAWNPHGLRTASHRSPLQLWSLTHREGQDFSLVGEDYGVDWEGPHIPCASNASVPEMQLLRPLSERELAALPNPNAPFSQALAVYLETVQTLKVMLNTEPLVKHHFYKIGGITW